jgi:hypothetical protein
MTFVDVVNKIVSVVVCAPIMVTAISFGGAFFGAQSLSRHWGKKAGMIGEVSGAICGLPIGFVGGAVIGVSLCYYGVRDTELD